MLRQMRSPNRDVSFHVFVVKDVDSQPPDAHPGSRAVIARLPLPHPSITTSPCSLLAARRDDHDTFLIAHIASLAWSDLSFALVGLAHPETPDGRR